MPDDQQSNVYLKLDVSVDIQQPSIYVIGKGCLEYITQFLHNYRTHQCLLLSDENVTSLYALTIRDHLIKSGYNVHLVTIPNGEQGKTMDTLIHLYEQCCYYQIERDDVIIAIGGGAVSDVGGMLAGTYLRGVHFAVVATTLVSMVTASVGGKVGINYQGYKNKIGMFKHADVIFSDVNTLETLPSQEYLSGLGELVNVGVLGDVSLFERLERNETDDLVSLIADAVQCKYRLVKKDPFDTLNIRMALNLGHTFGHAIEKLSNFTVPHGLAVSVGLRIACDLSLANSFCSENVVRRVKHTLLSLNLPIYLSGYAPDEVIEAMRQDKKTQRGKLNFVLPTEIGKVRLVSEKQISLSGLRQILSESIWEGK